MVNPKSLDKLFDQPPPHSLEAEMSLLGAMILDTSIYPEVGTIIDGPSAFFRPEHGAIYAALMDTFHREGVMNLVAIIQALRDKNALTDVGGPNYIGKLAEETPGPAAAAYYAKVVARKHQLRLLVEAGGRLVHAAMTDPTSDPSELAGVAAGALTAATQANAGMIVTMAEAMDQVIARSQSGSGTYLKTGFVGFDQTFGGFEHPGVVVLMGTPATGKTTWLCQCLWHMAKLGTRVLLFSNEQPPIRVAATTMTGPMGQSVHRIMGDGRATPEQVYDMTEIRDRHANVPFEMVRQSLNAQQVFANARLAKSRGVKVVAVDYLQRLPSLPGFTSGEERVGESMDILARIARDLDMTVVVVSQLQKSVGQSGERPTMFSGAWTPRIENAADQMFALYREHMHDVREDGQTPAQHAEKAEQTELLALKVKYGPMGVLDFTFNRNALTFAEGGTHGRSDIVPFD